MNILILSWRSPGHPNAGGAEKVTLEHTKAWVKAGHRVVWFSSEYSGSKTQEKKNGVIIIRKGGYFVGVRWEAFLWYKYGKHPKFDLVVDEFHGIPFFTPLYVRTRILGFIHEAAKDVWKLNPWPKPYNAIPATLGTIGEPLIFKLLYKKNKIPRTRDIPFMTVSESTRDDLVEWGIPRKNITIVHNGVDAGLNKYIQNKETIFTAMFLGAASEDKGIFDVIRAFSQIYRKDEDWQFWVVGDATKEILKRMKVLSKELNIEKRIKFFGYVNDAKKFKLLSRAHILINPSVREGWGLVNIESAALGTPVIGYDVPGVKDSVRNDKTGILVSKGNYRDLGDEALKLVKDRKRYEKYKVNCKKWASKFSWKKSVQEGLKLIESL